MKLFKWHIILILLASSVLYNTCSAQISSAYNFKFKNYTSQNGLVHNYTRKCLKDSKGFLWIITQNGLSKFDGATFTNFQHIQSDSTSLPVNDILDIAIDNDDNIWLAYAKGICYYNQKQYRFIKPVTQLHTEAQSIVFDKKNNAIFYNTLKGLFKINLATKNVQATALQLNYGNLPTSTFIDSKQRLFVAIERLGFYVYDIAHNTYKYYNNELWVRGFYEDDEHKIWIPTWGNNLLLFDSSQAGSKLVWSNQTPMQKIHIYQATTQAKKITGNNILWALTLEAGIILFDKKQHKPIQHIRYDASQKSSLLNDYSCNIYCDNDGIVWVCSWRGLSKINQQEQQFQSAELTFLKTDNYNLVSGICDDPYNKNICWLTAEGSGLVKYDKQKQQVMQWLYKTHQSIDIDDNYNWRWTKAIYKDNKNVLWISDYGGLIKINNGKVDTINISYKGQPTYTYTGRMVLKNNDWWIFSPKGLIQFNTITNQYQFYRNQPDKETERLPQNFFNDGCFISETEILCATKNGLYIFNIQTHQFVATPVLIGNIAYNAKKFFVIEKIKNKVFIGGENGLLEYDIVTKKFKSIGEQQDIFKIEMNALKKDALDKLWIYTQHGLFRYDPEKSAFKKFTTDDGLYENSLDPVQMFNYNDNMYVGYRMAYTKFNPLEVDVNNNIVKPFITEVKINNQLQKINIDSCSKATLQLHYTENSITINFTGIDYTSSEKIIFAHQLVGVDKDWVYDVTKRFASYSNLAGEHYIFKVKSCNSSGVWNNEVAQFQFNIYPPFWQTWWFKLLLVLSFVALVVCIAFYRIKKIRIKEEQKTAANKLMLELEMKALRSQMNPHFIFNSLNSIQKYIWENKQEDASEYLTKFSSLMRMILNHSMHKLITLEDEMLSLNLYLELEHRRCNNKFDYIISIDNDIKQNEILLAPMLLQPFIENAIWHGLLQKDSRGKLTIVIKKLDDNALQAIIEDDGIGRKKAMEIKSRKQNNTTSYGMTITEQRLVIADVDGRIGKIIIDDLYNDNDPLGTKVTLEIPIESFKKIREY